MGRVLDRNGVQLSRGMRVYRRPEGSRDVYYGVVVATVGAATALVRWDGADDDTYVASADIAIVDSTAGLQQVEITAHRRDA